MPGLKRCETPPLEHARAAASASSGLPREIGERHRAVGQRHMRDELRGLEHHVALALLHLERRRLRRSASTTMRLFGQVEILIGDRR